MAIGTAAAALGLANSIFQTFGSGASAGQGGFNLFKDFNNTDIKRQVAAQKELIGLNFENQLKLMDEANQYNMMMMDKQQGFNVQNMETQYAYNRYLSDLGRSIYASRNAGINPASKGVVASTGSVGMPSVAAPTAASPSAGSPSVTSSHYGANFPSNPISSLDSVADIELKQSQSELNRIDASSKRSKNIAEIELMKNQAVKYLKEAGVDEQKMRITEKAFDEIVDSYRLDNEVKKAEAAAKPIHAEAAKATAEAAKVSADAAQKQAENSAEANDIRRGELKEEVRWHDLQNAIDKARTQLYGDEVAIKNYLAPYQQQELVQMAMQLNSNKVLNDKEADAFADKLRSYLGLNEARIKELEAKARNEAAMAGLTEKEADWYVYHQVENTIFRSVDAIGNTLPWYGAKGQVNKQKIMSSMIDRQNYMTPSGYKGFRQKTTYEYGE